jgi:hypothetical protein
LIGEVVRRVLPLIAAITLLMLIGTVAVYCLTVSVTCDPWVIPRGGKTTITVTCDQGGAGSITVKTPSGISKSVEIIIPSGGGNVSKVYPDVFGPGATTDEVGEYEVIVYLEGCKYKTYFYVSFSVIPEVPLGVFTAVAACFVALGVKRLRSMREVQ